MKLLGLCSIGLEKVLANEVRKAGYKIQDANNGKIFFEAEEEGLYYSNIAFRTAERVLLVLGQFKAETFDELYDMMHKIEWQDYLEKDANISIAKLSSTKSKLFALTSIQSISQKAIFEKLCKKYKLLELPMNGAKAEIRIYIDKDIVTVGLDLSGDPLHKRGYRKLIGQAPLKETIAAGLVLLSGWKRKFPLHDPFCGSGTIPIEAALYGMDIAPGLFRNFAFSTLKIYNKKIHDSVIEKLNSQIRFDTEMNIFASDNDKFMIETAIKNATVAKVDKKINFFQETMEKLQCKNDYGYIITNPPYGERIGDDVSTDKLYSQMRYFKREFAGWKYCVISADDRFQDRFEERAEKSYKIQNGKLLTYYYIFGE